MPRMSLTADEARHKRRMYTRENRELWKQLGFRMLSAPVHDDERGEVLAELEVRRAQRLADHATAKDTGIATLVQIGRRNLNKPKSPREMKEFLKDHERWINFAEIEHCINEAKQAHTVYRNSRTNVDATTDEVVKQRLFAKEVAYGNLVAAWFKLAQARADASEPKTVFGVGDD